MAAPLLVSLTDSIITDSHLIQASPEISHKKTQYKVPMIQVHEHTTKGEQPTVKDTVLDVSSDQDGTEAVTEPVLQSCHITTNNSATYEDALLQYHTKLNVALKQWTRDKTDIK